MKENVIISRWKRRMPLFFKWIFGVAAFVGGLALAINTAIVAGGGTTHEWWNDLYPYLLGVSGGAAFVAKFTVKGGNEDNNDVKEQG